MSPGQARRRRQQHTYDLFVHGRVVARLEWRTQSRSETGWYLVRHGVAERLTIEAAIDELAHGGRSAAADSELTTELAALLSTPLAVDAAEGRLHGRPERRAGRFRRLTAAARVESTLSGVLCGDAFERVARRVTVLGSRVVAVFRDRDET